MEILDRRHNGVSEGQTGPLVGRLWSVLFLLLVGAFLKGSRDLHSLLGTMADSQLRAKALSRGRQGIIIIMIIRCLFQLKW